MEDPWGSNAWSDNDSEKVGDSSVELTHPPKWNMFERDADEDTIDVGVPSWSTASGSGWVEGTNLWHAESSTLDSWKSSLNSHETRETLHLETEEEDTKEREEDNKSPEPQAVLPTPPLSPLPTSSSTTPSSQFPPRPLINPPSPDHFGSFESAEIISEESHDKSSWTPQPHLPATDEPWGATWGETEDEGESKGENDEWELAQETRRKRDRKVPPELLESLVKQWDEFATSLNPKVSTVTSEHANWRKGLDSVDGLAGLVDSLLPVTSFPPPIPFNKTAVAKSVKETLRLTRSFPLTQSSPMAHLHASKGSTDWEKSVKAQKTAANDEWGWDLKHEPEENPAAADSASDKKSGGLLSFWSRKAASVPSAPLVDPPTSNSPISPTVMSKPTSPLTPERLSIDSSLVALPTTGTPPLPPDDVGTVTTDVPPSQPSAVSRFFNRFSRKPTAVSATSSGQEKSTSLSLSSDDLSFLSDITPSTTEGSLQSPSASASINTLGSMLSWPTKNSSQSSSKLPPLLPPPPPSHPSGHLSANSLGSDTSFDAAMADARFMDLLDSAVGGVRSSNSGYAPVIVDLLESPEETKPPLAALQSPDSPIPPAPTSLSSWIQSPAISTVSTHNNRNAPTVASNPVVPSIPPPHSPDEPSKQSIALTRIHNPLPPTPKQDLGDLAGFLSPLPLSGRSTPPRSTLLPQFDSPPSSKESTTASLLPLVSNHSHSVPACTEDDSFEFGDFGDFISTSLQIPSPPKVPQKTAKAEMHMPTLELVKKGAARQGRWPNPPSPIPQPLAPPPGPSSGLGYFSNSPRHQASRLDLLTDDSPVKATSVTGTLSVSGQAAAISQPLFAAPPSRPASTAFSIPAPFPALSVSRASSPLLDPNPASSKPAGGSGLSAQDLSFFEGL